MSNEYKGNIPPERKGRFAKARAREAERIKNIPLRPIPKVAIAQVVTNMSAIEVLLDTLANLYEYHTHSLNQRTMTEINMSYETIRVLYLGKKPETASEAAILSAAGKKYRMPIGCAAKELFLAINLAVTGENKPYTVVAEYSPVLWTKGEPALKHVNVKDLKMAYCAIEDWSNTYSMGLTPAHIAGLLAIDLELDVRDITSILSFTYNI